MSIGIQVVQEGIVACWWKTRQYRKTGLSRETTVKKSTIVDATDFIEVSWRCGCLVVCVSIFYSIQFNILEFEFEFHHEDFYGGS